MANISIHEMWNQALSAYKQGNKRAAIDIFSIIAKADARITFNLACIHVEEKNYPLALKLLKKSLEIDNSLSVAYFQRAYVRYQQGNFDSAYKNYLKTILLLRDGKLNLQGQGLDLTLFENEIRMNMVVANKAKEITQLGQSSGSFQLFTIPPGLFFLPIQNLTDKKKKGALKIDTNHDIISTVPKRNHMLSPVLNEGIKESPASFSSTPLGIVKMFTPISPENIRIKIFWNSNDAMAILSHRFVLLNDLVRQIRSKLQIDFDPTLLNPATGCALSDNNLLWNHINDPGRSLFPVRIQEFI